MTIESYALGACPDDETSESLYKLAFVRNPKVVERQVDDAIFLIDPENDTIFHLNQLGTGLWRLMAEPTELVTAVGIVQQAFPDDPPERVRRDVVELIGDLVKNKLVAPVRSMP